MGQTTMRVTAKETGRGLLNSKSLGKHAVTRNTILLSAGMAALYGMNQLAVAAATTTFAFVSGRDGLAGIGPAIFLATAAFAAFAAGRAMDHLGRVPVLAVGFGLGILGCVITGLGASLLSVTAVIGGFVLIGTSMGTVMLSRAAAADMYTPERTRKIPSTLRPARLSFFSRSYPARFSSSSFFPKRYDCR
jgi:MFS family permease